MTRLELLRAITLGVIGLSVLPIGAATLPRAVPAVLARHARRIPGE